MTSQTRRLALTVATAAAVVLFAAGILVGRTTVTPRPVAVNAVTISDGVPVGVLDTPAGALAASDNYLAVEAQSDEQQPALFAALAANTFTPAFARTALRLASQDRASDSAVMGAYAHGAHALAIIAARRLDSYTPSRAVITTWIGGVLWGPTITPRQTWNLASSTLVWQDGHWLLANNHIAGIAPVPSIVYVDGTNNQAAAFSVLTGMSAPFYGAG